MDKKNIKLIIISTIIFILITTCIWLVSKNKVEDKNINVYEVSNINDNKDPVIRDIYHQFNPEDDILFNLIGSGNDINHYAYYYKNDKITKEQLDNTIKTFLTIHSFDYKNAPIDKVKNCYQVKISDLNITYEKLFNKTNFQIDKQITNPQLEINNNTVCIHDYNAIDYNYVLDTLYINATYQENELLIYERVAFIKLEDSNIEFYSDYDMKNLIYKANRSEIELSFLNNLNIVSNVLVRYQEKFDIYTYTFEKNNGNYYFKSISK